MNNTKMRKLAIFYAILQSDELNTYQYHNNSNTKTLYLKKEVIAQYDG